ncbi:Regulator of nucleoside diphosphate kinase [bioreactor metagenome]|uniref:Regulator of nucleoside diphosphate kinase n=1 Tax=bioreactor metagenome TaxID=1076179 RepID=A0A645F5V6_9ZZZZ
MNSRVLMNLNGKDMEVSLVYPCDADWGENRLSVLSPVGTAILGYSEGDDIEWKVPSGTARITIKKLLYQPEARGDYHL